MSCRGRFAALLGLSLLGPALTASAQEPGTTRERAERIRLAQQQLAALEDAGRAAVLSERGLWVGTDVGVSRRDLIEALEPLKQQRRRDLLDELRRLGGARPNALVSGPQVGMGITGGFVSLFLNGQHAGKPRCPV